MCEQLDLIDLDRSRRGSAPLKFDLVCCQIMGWIFMVSSTAGAIAVASSLISN